jgi:hypothetical protein
MFKRALERIAKNIATRYCSWFKHCVTNQKVAVSIPEEVIEFC